MDSLEGARQEERRRIASELHDRVLQVLAAVALRLEAARKHVRKTETETLNDLQISEKDVRSSIREVRNVLAGGHNGEWVAGTLVDKIKHEVASIEHETGLEIRVEIDPPQLTLCDPDLEYGVFHATAEALRNVGRHALASEACLSIVLTGDTLRVSLSDNGQGFDPSVDSGEASHRTGRYGLVSMKSRIERLGGNMAIRSAAAQGTTVSFTLPTNLPTGASDDGIRNPGRRPLRLWLGSTIVAVTIATLVLVFIPAERGGSRDLGIDVLGSAVRHYNQVSKGIARPDSRPAGFGFDLLDLSPWGFKILSKKTRQMDGQESRVFVYQAEATKDLLVAEEFKGVTLPPGATLTAEAFGTTYSTYSQEGINAVAWQDDGTLCVLTSAISPQDLLDLAQRISRERLVANIQ